MQMLPGTDTDFVDRFTLAECRDLKIQCIDTPPDFCQLR